jgi:hypothetical protein
LGGLGATIATLIGLLKWLKKTQNVRKFTQI